MKSVLVFGLVISTFFSSAQEVPARDQSPMDMSTYPNNYAMSRTRGKVNEPLTARVIYSRPQKSERVIFGELVPYNSIWRLGANENTEIEFFRDVKIGGKPVKKGRYSVFAIATPEKWTLILNTDLNAWGAFMYDPKKDVIRSDYPVETAPFSETFYMYFEKAAKGFNLNAGWDTIKVSVPISI